MSEAVIIEGVRTPIGKVGGALADVRPDDLVANVIAAAHRRAGVRKSEIDDVVIGCANQAGEDNRDVARMSSLLAGLPVEVSGVTVNRLCGSGLEAVAQVSRSIACDAGQLYVAGGVESMTRAPLVQARSTRAFQRGTPEIHDSALGWRFVNPKMIEMGHTDTLGVTAENVAQELGIRRAEQDRFSVASHEKAVAARDRLRAEIEPVETAAGLVDQDQGPRDDASLEALAQLPPVFASDGTVTAGNASPLSDGAGALIVASRSYARSNGLHARARVLGATTVGVAPRTMGLGPVPAVQKLLARIGLGLDDFDLIEINEAFAAQVLGCCRQLDLDADDPRLNVNGGAIAIGHPLGCSGARLVISALHELERRHGARRALIAMCIGVGQGISLALERVAD